jgi:hypothetical protein
MTTLQRLLNSIALAGVTLSAGVMAQSQYCPKTFEVLERTTKDNYVFQKVELEKLFCTGKFEGEHFKIVYATEDEAISFDNENQAIVKKAANVYHHLTVARNFWINEVKSEYVSTLPQIVIRIDITNAYSSTRQFKNAEQEKNYNNAWTTPEGQTPRVAKEQRKWGKEIWFSPSKKIDARKEVKSEGNNPVHESLLLIKDPIVDMNKSALIYTGLALIAAPTLADGAVLNGALQRVGAIALIYGAIEVTKHMDKWFMNKWYYIDTAMIPDVIYHEYAHIAMSDTMKTVHSIPVIEGMADYFATRVANRRKMYEEIEGFSKNKSKDAENRGMYHPYLEGSWNATSDFTLSLLWLGRKEFEKQNAARAAKGQGPLANYDEIIFQTHYHLDENSDIANDLNQGLINACKEKCSSVRAGVNTFNNVFEKKGFN